MCIPIRERGMCTPAVLSRRFSWPQMDFRHHWNRINLSQPMNNAGVGGWGGASGDGGHVVSSENHICGLADIPALGRSEAKLGAGDGAIGRHLISIHV